MNKWIKYLCYIITIFIIGINSVLAESNYRISLSASTVTKGNSVSLYIKGNELTGGFTISSSNSNVASISTNTAWVENNTATITVSAISSGSSTITVTPTTVSDDNGNDLTLSAKTLTITVTEPSNNKPNNNSSNNNIKKSNDATLKKLEIENIKLDKEFKSDITEYKVEVEAGTEKIKVTAEANHSKASVSGTGEITVKPGANKIEVIVAAEDGTTKTYTITLNVKEYDPIEVTIDNQKYTVIRKKDDLPEVELFEEKKIAIDKEEVDGYYNDKLKIYLVGLKDEKGNTKLFIYEPEDKSYKEYKWITIGGITLYLTEPNNKLTNFKKYNETINNTKVDIYKINSKDKTGLIYGTNIQTGNTAYYIYDKEEETLARYFDKEINIYKQIEKNYKKYFIIGIILVIALIVTLIIVSLTKSKKR